MKRSIIRIPDREGQGVPLCPLPWGCELWKAPERIMGKHGIAYVVVADLDGARHGRWVDWRKATAQEKEYWRVLSWFGERYWRGQGQVSCTT